MIEENLITTYEHDFRSLEAFLNQVPKTPWKRTNLIEIAGFPNREQVISNFLAFYLDDDEHKFGRHLFNALVDLIHQKAPDINPEIFQTEYTVEREKKYLDILITSNENTPSQNGQPPVSSWSIIIENKVNAGMNNDLDSYWDRVNAVCKIGVVLSLRKIEPEVEDGVIFVNILHSELLNAWKASISNVFLESDDRHLLFFKDFIQNIESYYTDKTMDKINEERLGLLHKNWQLIQRLDKLNEEVKPYLVGELISVMKKFNFIPYYDSWKVIGKHFYADNEITTKESGYECFRFYFYIEDLHKYNLLTVYFELHGKHTIYGDLLREHLSELRPADSSLQLVNGTGGGKSSNFCHIFTMEGHELDSEQGNSFAERLEAALRRNFFGPKSIVESCVNLVKHNPL